MFSKKYTDDLLKERIDKLSQLDKIEFNQRIINENMWIGKILNYQHLIVIVMMIFLSLVINFFIKARMFIYLDLINLAKTEIMLVHDHTSTKEQIVDYPKTITGLCKWSTGKCDFYDTCKPHG